MPEDILACVNQSKPACATIQPVQKANAPLLAAIEAAKAARLPAHIEAQIARIGVKPERPEPRRVYAAWKPTPDDPTPPF